MTISTRSSIDSVLCDILMGPEVQVEALFEYAVRDFTDPALPSSASIGHHNINATEISGDVVKRTPDGDLFRHVTGDCNATDPFSDIQPEYAWAAGSYAARCDAGPY